MESTEEWSSIPRLPSQNGQCGVYLQWLSHRLQLTVLVSVRNGSASYGDRPRYGAMVPSLAIVRCRSVQGGSNVGIALQTLRQSPLQRIGCTLRTMVSEQLHLWSFLLAVVLCGLVFGGVAAGQLNTTDTLALGNSVEQLLQAIAQHQLASAGTLWWQRMVADGQFLALLWLLGVSVIGLPFIVIAMFLRSFSIGFSVGFTVIQFGWRGFLLASIAIFLHQLLSLTALVLASAIAIRFSMGVLRQAQPLPVLSISLVKYTSGFVLCSVLLMAGAAVQSNLAPPLLHTLLGGH